MKLYDLPSVEDIQMFLKIAPHTMPSDLFNGTLMQEFCFPLFRAYATGELVRVAAIDEED